MRFKNALLLLALLAVSFINVFSQETTSELQGVVTGENRAALQGATITAIHVPTGTRYTTSTRKDGRYNLPNVRVGGPYEVTATFVGFETMSQKDISLLLGQSFKADFSLVSSAGKLTEVTVSSTRNDKVFSRSRTGSAEVINRTQIDRLPTINRSIADFTRLTPSANGSSFAGRSSLYNNLTVNGASFNNTFGLAGSLGGQTNSQPISIDALDQIQVNIAPYDVTLGSFTGAGINSVTRSGTNNFRGSVYYYWKNPYLTGTRVGATTLIPQQFDFNNRGANIGGYLVKNKVFFFLSGEQERQSSPATSYTASTASKAPVPGSVSQANGDTLEKLRQFLISKYNYDPGAFENYNYNTRSDKVTVRIDVNINSKNTFNINYYYLKSSRNSVPSTSGAPTGGRTASNTGVPFFGSSYIINNNFNIVIAELNTRFSNRLSNKLQVGYNRLRDFRSSPGGIFPLVDIENGAGSTYTSFGYEPFTAFNSLNTDTYQLNDIVTLFKGKHNITIGTQNTYNKFRNGFAPNYYGTYRFKSLTDFYNSANNGIANASRYEFRYSTRKDGGFPFAEISALQLGFFAQDKWNATNNLTITAGLRADLPIFGDDFTANTVADTLKFRGGMNISTGGKPKTSVLWSPRVGFNWDAKGDKTIQVRGGLGIFSGAPPFVYISNQASNNGVDFGSFLIQPGVAGVLQSDPRFIFNGDVNKNRPANATASPSYNLAFTDRNFKFPQIFRSNLAVDKKIFGDITATLEGIYTKDINAVTHQNVGLERFGTPLAGSDHRVRYSSPQIYLASQATQSTANPNITDAILMTNTSKGYTYNITGQLQRNVANLYTMIAYTFGDSRSVNDGGSIAQSIWRDRAVTGDPNATELGYSNFYQPHRIVAAAFYRKEYKKYFATSIGLTFEAANGGNASYVYNGDVNNDALTTNDLIYVPKDINDIVLEAVPTSGSNVDPRTPATIWAQLDAYIKQDPYLSHRRGMYAERNGLQLPFYKRLDLNFTQDFIVKVGKQTNTIRFTADIFNFGNLLNKNWGIFRTTNRTAILNFRRVETGPVNTGRPVYTFPFLDATTQTPLTNSFVSSTGQGSRFQVQFGIRYLFQ